MLYALLKIRNFPLFILILFFLSIISFYSIVALVPVWLLLIVIFDAYGYYFVLHRMRIEQANISDFLSDTQILIAYKIIKTMFNVLSLLLIFIISSYNFYIILSILILYLTGWVNYLFYVILKIPFPHMFNWMNFIPYKLYKKYVLKNDWMTEDELYQQMLVGLIIVIFILF